MKFRMIVNGDINLDMFLHSIDDWKILQEINAAPHEGTKVKLAFNYFKKKLKGNYGGLRPVGFIK